MCEKIMKFADSLKDLISLFARIEDNKVNHQTDSTNMESSDLESTVDSPNSISIICDLTSDIYRYFFLEIDKIIYLKRKDIAYESLKYSVYELEHAIWFFKKYKLKIIQHTHYFFDLAHVLRLCGIHVKYSEIVYIGAMKTKRLPYLWINIKFWPTYSKKLIDFRDYLLDIKKKNTSKCHITEDTLILYII
jgi:hypothetical protein